MEIQEFLREHERENIEFKLLYQKWMKYLKPFQLSQIKEAE